jgi:large subunit ribosomal protein L9
MQVVFVQDIKNIARKGDVKNVKDGYFQNYLLPRKLAVLATESKMKEAELLKKQMVLEKGKIKEQAVELKKKMDGHKITIKGKAKGDKLYGSIGEKEIADLLEKDFKVRFTKEHFKLSENIKVIGSYEIPISLADGVEAKVTLEVKGEK